jgi:MFS transporter, UMF1 family
MMVPSVDSGRLAGGRRASRRAIGSWLMFDWATQPHFTLITTFVFAPYFVSRVAETPVSGQALWGYATGIGGFAIAIFSPILGAVADAGGGRKTWIAVFSVLLVFGAAMLWFAVPGGEMAIVISLVGFGIATIGAEFATVFTNAMMSDLVDDSRLGRLSATGWAVGYAGGLVSLVAVLGFLVANPQNGLTVFGVPPILGLDSANFEGDRASGPFTALWYAVFVLPLFLFTPDVPRRLRLGAAVRTGLGNLRSTLLSLRHHGNVALYLLAHMVYADGLVALFAFGGIYAAGTFGWSSFELGLFGILLTITGTIGAVIGGRLDDRYGGKSVIGVALGLLIVASVGILSIDRDHIGFVFQVAPSGQEDGLFSSVGERLYLAIGALIGALAGPLQAASRALMARISPAGRPTEFFGLYALSGKVTSFAGPLAVGVLTAVADSQRIGISILVVFFAFGAVLLIGVRPVRS